MRQFSSLKAKEVNLRLPQLPFFEEDAYHFDEDQKIMTLLMAAHRRAGKSVGVALQDRKDMDTWMREDHIYKIRQDVDSAFPLIGFVAPTKVQARGIIWPSYKQFMRDIPGVKFNNSTLSITAPRPWTDDEINVQLYASKNHDRIRGMKFRKVNADEVQDAPEAALESSIKPALRDSQGRLNVTGTAKGMDYFYRMIVRALENKYPCYLFPVDKTGVFTPAEIEEIRKDCMGGAFEREYMLDFTARLDGVFFHAKIDSLKKEPWFYESSDDQNLVNVVGVDIGVAQGFAAWTAKVDYRHNLIHIQDFYQDYTYLLEFKRDMMDDGFTPDIIFLPHDGNKRTMGRERPETTKQLFKETFKGAMIKVNKKTPELMRDISMVNEHLHLIRMPPKEVPTDAHRGLVMLSEFRRRQDTTTGAYLDAIDKKEGVDHVADAMRSLMAGLKCKNGIINRRIEYKSNEQRFSEASDTWEPSPYTGAPDRRLVGDQGVYADLMRGGVANRGPHGIHWDHAE